MTEKEFNKIAEGFFDINEDGLSSPDIPESSLYIKKGALTKLVRARRLANIPFKINSAFRSPAHNKEVGGKKDSAHLDGLAFDISAINSSQKFRIMYGVIKAGFKRIGYYENFIHVDNSLVKGQEVIW